MSKTKAILILSSLFLLIFLGSKSCVYVHYQLDLRNKPWAYSSDPEASLLIGRWQGTFTDPDGVQHQLEMQIDEPTPWEERNKKWMQRRRAKRKVRNRNPRGFDGFAYTTVNGVRDTMELWGSVQESDFQQFSFHIRPLDGKYRTGFTISQTSGTWQNDQMQLITHCTYHREGGAGYSDSADPRFEQRSPFVMKRVEAD